MRSSSLETFTIGQFLAALKDRRTELPYPQNVRPMLYLKCWGSDYPYLLGVEQERRWLPVVMDSVPPRFIRN